MQKITSQDVSAWMVEQLAKVHELQEYGQVNVEINQFRHNEAVPRFSIFCGRDEPESGSCASIEECFEKLSKITPKTIAANKREQAARLLAEADAIEAKTN